MPMKLNVGVSRKFGLPNYGSVGASCSLEMEVDTGLLETDPAGLQARIRHVYAAARQAVQDELVRLRTLPLEHNGGVSSPCAASLTKDDHDHHVEGNGKDAQTRGNRTPSRRPATANQLRAIVAIARRRRTDLSELLRNEFDVKEPEELSLRQASQLIDRLKAHSEG